MLEFLKESHPVLYVQEIDPPFTARVQDSSVLRRVDPIQETQGALSELDPFSAL